MHIRLGLPGLDQPLEVMHVPALGGDRHTFVVASTRRPIVVQGLGGGLMEPDVLSKTTDQSTSPSFSCLAVYRCDLHHEQGEIVYMESMILFRSCYDPMSHAKPIKCPPGGRSHER